MKVQPSLVSHLAIPKSCVLLSIPKHKFNLESRFVYGVDIQRTQTQICTVQNNMSSLDAFLTDIFHNDNKYLPLKLWMVDDSAPQQNTAYWQR